MGQPDATSGPGESAGTQRTASTGRPPVTEPLGVARWLLGSGVAAGVGASVSIVAGLRALRRGDSGAAFVRLLAGALLATVAASQRRREPDVDQTDVVRTAPDVEGVGTGVEQPERATGEEASDVAGTSVDIEDAVSGPDEGATGAGGEGEVDVEEAAEEDGADEHVETDTVVDAAEDVAEEGHSDGAIAHDETTGEETPEHEDLAAGAADATADEEDSLAEVVEESVGGPTAEEEMEPDREGGELAGGEFDRLGEAAFDEQSQRVPAPQQAFNEGLLSTGAEAFWGIREDDDTVVVSAEFDPLNDVEGVEYVASSEVDDDDRGVRIPDTVLNHWDDVANGGDAVVSGTGIVFATSDELREEDQLVVVPAPWADEVLEQPLE